MGPSYYTIFVLIIISHLSIGHPYAETCKSLIKERINFVDKVDEGVSNFINAYRFVTLKQIDITFEDPGMNFETDVKAHRRNLQHYFSNLKTPAQWCPERLTQVTSDLEMNPNEEERMIDCLEFTSNLLKNPEDKDDLKLIFQRFYEDWSYNELEHLASHLEHNILPQIPGRFHTNPEARALLVKKLKYFVTTYSDPYFRYFEEVFNNISPRHGNFRSIEQYCEHIGHIYVKGSTSNAMLHDML